MRLLTQWIIIISLIILLAFAGGIVTQRFVIWPNAKMLTDQLDRKELEQVLLGFDGLRAQLLSSARDYAYWTATYNYLQQPINNNYMNDNMSLDTFVQGNFQIVVFKSADGKFQKVFMTTPDQSEFLSEPILTADDFSSVLPDPLQASPGAPLENSGYMRTPVGPIGFAAATVMKNDLTGLSNGVILIGQFVNNDLRDDLRDSIKKKFDMQLLGTKEKVIELKNTMRDESNKVAADMLDVKEKPLFRISMLLPPSNLNKWWSLASTVSLAVFLFGTALAMIMMYRSLVLPIRAISNYLKDVEKSADYSARVNIDSRNELGVLAKQCNSLLANIDSQHHRLEAQAEELRRLSLNDGLTQISNRRHFDEVLDLSLAHAQRNKMPLSLIICDIDHFKLFNDTYGHQGGDKGLQQFAEILLQARHRKTDLVARYGGEEFAILLPDTDEHGTQHVLTTIQKLLEKANIPHASSLVSDHLTVSMGATCMHAPFDLTAQELIRRADEALYLAKKNGRNRGEFWVGAAKV
jgi:diguanylate cyclase (GGDEF)-like protein